MTAQHTPGPWTATIGKRGAHINVANDHNHPLSFSLSYSEIDSGQQAAGQANARLIASAPELFHELDVILAELEDGHTVTIEPGTVKAAHIRAAIAKATEKE